MAHCICGGKLARVHRSLAQKFVYMAVYECKACGEVRPRPRGFMFYFADETRCPLCGTDRLRCLAERDGIDRMHWNLFNLVRWAVGVRLYHCRFCRIQFYDKPRGARRKAANV